MDNNEPSEEQKRKRSEPKDSFDSSQFRTIEEAFRMEKPKGIKDDNDKSRLDLVDPDWLLAVGHVLKFGAQKYGERNWKNVVPYRYHAAAMRHLLAIMRGEYIDQDTGQSHASHLACCSMFLHHLGGPDAASYIPRHAGETVKDATQRERLDPTSLHDHYAQATEYADRRGPSFATPVLNKREPR